MTTADRPNAGSRQNFHLDVPLRLPIPISKEMQGSDSPIPLSPQWLLPKPGDNKLGILTGDPHSNPHHANRPDPVRTLGNDEDFHDAGKQRDVFMPSLYDSETGRRDRWRDEERETNSATRCDRWRETEKDLGDGRKIERWSDNSTRDSGVARRAPSERWTDSATRENNYDQRREGKWNTRWGPDEKESENRREKWSDSGKDLEGSRDRGASNLTIHGKDMISQVKDADKELEQYSRAWRSSSSLARGRGETSHNQSLAPNKQTPIFGSGRGKGENGASVFSAGRGKVNCSTGTINSVSSRSYPLGFVSERSDGAHGDLFVLRYSRMKLLDIYRTTDLRSLRMSLEGFIEVPSLTVGEPLEPFALSAPTSEELVTLKGIEKGDTVSSGVPQVSKDGSTGRNSTDSFPTKQPRLGNREDPTSIMRGCKDESIDDMKGIHPSYLESPSYDKYSHVHGADTKMSSSQNLHPYQGDFSTEARARVPEMGWLHSQKGMDTEQRNTLVSSSYLRDGLQWKNSDRHPELRRDSKIKRHSSEVLDLEREGTVSHGQEDPFISRDRIPAGKFQQHPSPEELNLYYKDPQGRIQGPFAGVDLIGWFEAGYFGIDLQVRLTNAPVDAPFSSLGDVMPHLRAKARPPPGFGVAKQNDVDVSSSVKFNSLDNTHSSIGELDALINVQRNRHEAATDAENRFIESLMSGNMNSTSSEHYPFTGGMQGYGGPMVVGDNMKDMNYILAQRMSLERHKSLPNSLPFWSVRDTSPMVAKPDIIPESPSPHSKFLPPMGKVSRQIPPSPPQVDFLSLLQAAGDKSPSPSVNSALPVWPNFPEGQALNNLVHGGIDIIKERIDLQQNQHIASQSGFGSQHQRLHQQNQPSLSQILTQPGDLSSGVIAPEKLLASEIIQDPQMLNLLQQQYLMSQIQLQLQSQSPLPTHLSLFDKYLLLKQQQQQQEQQQQQMLLHQQHLLSQVLSGHQSHPYFAEPSLAHLGASVPAGNASVDHLALHMMHEALYNNQQVPVLRALDDHTPTISSSNVCSPLDVSHTISTGPAVMQLPHQMFDHSIQSKVSDPNLQQEATCLPSSDPNPILPISDSLLSEPPQKNVLGAALEQKSVVELEDNGKQHKLPSICYADTSENMASISSDGIDGLTFPEGAGTTDVISSVSDQVGAMKISPDSIPEEASVAKAVKDRDMNEAKKPSDTKSKKQKNPKAQPVSDLGIRSSKIINDQQHLKSDFEIERVNGNGRKAELEVKTEVQISDASAAEPLYSQPGQLPSTNILADDVGTVERTAEHGEVGMWSMSSQATSNQRAWKPAPGFKPKSLLEIQLEEQRSVRVESIVSETSAAVAPTSSPTPWVGVVTGADNQPSKDFAQSPSSTQFTLGSVENPSNSSKYRKSQLHDLLAEEVLAKSNEGYTALPDEKSSSLHSPAQVCVQTEVSSVADEFIEAKDTKKGRRKAAKAKASGPKASPPVAPAYLSIPPASTEKSKSTHQAEQEKELLPVPPAGPSLGDFVFWKGDQTNSSAAPAWSSDSGKIKKPTSLRDIQREQEKRHPSLQQQIPIPSPAKVQSDRANRGNGASWPVPGSSPSKAASPNQTKVASPMQPSSHTSSQSKFRIEDDLFWGPLDQSKQETKQSEFPSLANPNGWGGKGTSVKGAPGSSLSRQNPSSIRAAEHSLSQVTGQAFSKGKKDAAGSKHSEAADFRDWCESELVKLTGTNDTSFLEFCMKQSTSEAEMLLRENLGSLDRNHEFIDKFLNYKDFLSSDVVDMAFSAPQSDPKKRGGIIGSNNTGTGMEKDGEGGGKKKGKKGKKVNPAVLGFNVVSNRIMMGEIQTIED